MTYAAQSIHGVLNLVAGFFNALYQAATSDFDAQKFASKSRLELADMGFQSDHVALVIRPHHLNA